MAGRHRADKKSAKKNRRDQSNGISTDRSIAARWGDPYGRFSASNETYLPPGSLSGDPRELRLTRARSEGTAASSDQRNWGEFGAGNEPSDHNKPGV